MPGSPVEQRVLSLLAEREDELVAFASELIATPSPNPPGDERAVVGMLSTALASFGYRDLQILAADQARPNLLARIGGPGGRSLVFSGHIDTKPTGNEASWTTPPYQPTIVNGRLYGLGAADMKAAVAAMIFAGRALSDAEALTGELRLILTADEEAGAALGAKFLVDQIEDADGILVGEPTGVDRPWEYLAVASRGVACFRVRYESGWTQALDGLPGLTEMNADMAVPSLKPDLISGDGKQMAIPYYNGTILFTYNKSLLAKSDIAPPTTWAEFTAACVKLKKAGVEYPYAAFWDADFGLIFYNFLAQCASEGMTTGFDATTLEPTFDTDPVAISVLEQWQEWFKLGLVSTGVLSSTYSSVSGLFSAGKAAFSTADTQFVKPWQTTKGTPAYKNTEIALMPGKTHATMTFMAVYAMTKSAQDRDATWEFMKFMAWRDSKQGNQYVVPFGYLVEGFGLTAPYKGLLAENRVKEAFSFLDYSVYLKQSKLAQAMLFPVDRASWFTGFQTAIGSALQEAIVGHTTAAKALKSAADFVRKHLK